MYAQISNNEITYGPASLPCSQLTVDGWITGFRCLDNANLKHYGWLPVEYAELSENQKQGEPTVEENRVYYPAVEIPQAEITAINESSAKTARDTAEDELINVHGVDWQVADTDRNRMQETISTATRLGYPQDIEIGWILADNTARMSTKADLEAVLNAFSLRRQAIFEQYVVWRSGDKLQPFQYIAA